jgi:hypothetical protein
VCSRGIGEGERDEGGRVDAGDAGIIDPGGNAMKEEWKRAGGEGDKDDRGGATEMGLKAVDG